MTEWWDLKTGIYLGSFGGAGLGIMGGLLGTLAGVFAPRGKLKVLVMGLVGVTVLCCLALLICGIAALIQGQPRHVWYGPLLVGAIGTLVVLPLAPVILLRYRQAEQRKLDAESLRRS